jgi:magnesium chelatase family protein
MIVYSFVRDAYGLKPVEVEVILQRGLPKIEILGLPDRGLQESSVRIQSAIVNQGYQFPKAQKVLVNIRPLDVKKSGCGLELSIALAILHLTEQKKLPTSDPICVYGELALSGEVLAPKDIELLPKIEMPLLTGESKEVEIPPIGEYFKLPQLKDEFMRDRSDQPKSLFVRPSPVVSSVPESVARLLEIVAVGEHSILLAGPAGSGKTTFTQNLLPFLRAPTVSEEWDIRQTGKIFQEKRLWRPLVAPHHSITISSMLGGGNMARPGAIVKANHGILVLDELLEFHLGIQSALREPIEQKTITVSRNTKHNTYDSQFLIIGATNLCRCGAFVPDGAHRCRCSSLELRKYIEKLSGPLLDRFSLFALSHQWSDPGKSTMVSVQDIMENVSRGVEFSDTRNKVRNELWTEKDILELLEDKQSKSQFPEFKSWRRYLSFLRVAKTLADLDLSLKIKKKHLMNSFELTTENHLKMEKISYHL